MYGLGVYLPSIDVLSVGPVVRELTPHTLYPTTLDIPIIIVTLSFRFISISSVTCFASSIINLCEIKKFGAHAYSSRVTSPFGTRALDTILVFRKTGSCLILRLVSNSVAVSHVHRAPPTQIFFPTLNDAGQGDGTTSCAP